MPVVISKEDGREMFTSFEPDSEYHGGPGGGQCTRNFVSFGMRYVGRYENDQENGYGKLTSTANPSLCGNESSYEGEWQDGRFHGEGVHKLPSGTVYEGQFVAGQRQGHGCLTLTTPSHTGRRQHRGEFMKNQRNGWGVYTVEKPTMAGMATYAGQWAGDVIQGRGYSLGAALPGSCDLADAAPIDVSRFASGQKVGEGVRWVDTRKAKRDKNGNIAPEYRDPTGKRVLNLKQPPYYGPWRLQDGVMVEEIDEATAAAIVQGLGLTVPSFPFDPPLTDPTPAPPKKEALAPAEEEGDAEGLDGEEAANRGPRPSTVP